jgi:fatty acid desaturase
LRTTTTVSLGGAATEGTALSQAEGTARYAKLRADVTAAGILDRDYLSYGLLIAVIIAGMAVSLFFVIRLPISAALVVCAGSFAFFAVQACGIVHDAGHRTIFRSKALNSALGEAVAFMLAMGFSSWRLQHNAHHAYTNMEEQDPDLDIPLHAFTLRQFQRQSGIWRCARRHQALIFMPMRVLVVVSRRLAEVEYLRTQTLTLSLVIKAMVLLLGIGVWFVVPFLIFPLAKALLVMLIVHVGMGFYLSNIFAPNHKGMPQLSRDTTLSFLEQQIVTSRNITPGPITDFVYLGLNYQIEHHLFPNCPRRRLKRITPYVREICRETGLEFAQTGIVETHRIILRELNKIATSPAG